MISGKVIIDHKTKKLTHRISSGQIAIIFHEDLDLNAAEALVEQNVQAVINLEDSISGKYPNKGPLFLINSGIPLFEAKRNLAEKLAEGNIITISHGQIMHNGILISKCKKINKTIIEQKINRAENDFPVQLSRFITNTLEHADKEKNLFIDLLNNCDMIKLQNSQVKIKGRQVLIVIRGFNYKEDLLSVEDYLEKLNPFIIAVDGAADGCLQLGLKPDVIFGDMDSVSGNSLRCGSQLIVHAYPDGSSPGLKRIEELGLQALKLPLPGTSEDAAILMAYQHGADNIFTVGTHSSVIDFLQKGRQGMGSTILVKMIVGNKLIDLKGISRLKER